MMASLSKSSLVQTGSDWTSGAEEAGGGILSRRGMMTLPGLILDWCSWRADSEGVEVCIFFGNFITKSLCNLLLISCTKLLDDGIGWDTFGGKDRSKPSNQKISSHNWLARIRNSLGFVVLNSKSNKFKLSYWKVHRCSPVMRALYLGLRLGTCMKSYSLNQPMFLTWSDRQSSWWSQAWGWSQSKDGERYMPPHFSSCILCLCSRNSRKPSWVGWRGRCQWS